MIIGITGTFSSGKGTVVEFLKKKGFKHYSARAFITEEIAKRGLIVNRDSMILVANSLRENFGPEYIAKSLYEIAEKEGGDAIIESLRCVGEIKYLQQLDNFICLGVDADQKLRYDRAISRGSETDHISFEKFKAQEDFETNVEHEFKANLRRCIEVADFVIDNNGNLDELEEQIKVILKQIEIKI